MQGDTVHPASLDADALGGQCAFRASRRGGPGGQHRNKVATAIVIEHLPTGITAQAAEHRSQRDNRRVALFRLRINLALDVRLPVTDGYQPSPLWRSRCRKERMQVNPAHADYPALLAEALDVLAASSFDAAAAAGRLGCSATQLIKLLRAEPRALEQANRARAAAGLHPLR